MVGLLQIALDFLAIVGTRHIVDAREETIEQVNHIAVAGGCHEVL